MKYRKIETGKTGKTIAYLGISIIAFTVSVVCLVAGMAKGDDYDMALNTEAKLIDDQKNLIKRKNELTSTTELAQKAKFKEFAEAQDFLYLKNPGQYANKGW